MATILQTNPFRFNKDDVAPATRWPDLALRAYSFNIQLDSISYSVRLSFNIWTNNAQVSISSGQEVLVANTPLIQTFSDGHPNYLASIPVFDGYTLVWDVGNQQFVFSSI